MSWNESVDAAQRLGRMFEDFALVSSKFGEVANLETHVTELIASVAKHKADVEKAKADARKARDKAEQIIAEANDKAIGIINKGEAAAADTIARSRSAADEITGAVEAKHKATSAACEMAAMRLDELQSQIVTATTELSKTEARLQLARDKVSAILRG